MITMLRKFRVDVDHVMIIPEMKDRPSDESWKRYCMMQQQFLFDKDLESPEGAYIPAKLATDDRRIRFSKRQVRIGEVIRKHSSNATMVVVNLPVPKNIDQGHYQYMCWLETLSYDLPPTILMRGNQDHVMTFYS